MRRRTLKIEQLGDPWHEEHFSGIRLKGQWLTKAGFHPGHRVAVTVISPGLLHLRVLSELGSKPQPAPQTAAPASGTSEAQEDPSPRVSGAKQQIGSDSSPDLKVVRRDSFFLFQPLTDSAREWMEVHCPAGKEHQYWCSALVVEARYVEDLLRHAREDGLVL